MRVLLGKEVSFQKSAHEWAHSIVQHADITIEVIGSEYLSEKAVYIVNHRSSADILYYLNLCLKNLYLYINMSY